MPEGHRPPLTSGRRPVVMICAAVYWNGTTMLDHHLARELSRYADVVYVEPATSFLTKWRNPSAGAAAAGPWLEPVEPGITVARPRVNPLMERRIGKPLAMILTRLTMRFALRKLGVSSVHAVVLPSLNPLFGVVGERYKVFYASDDLVAGAGLMGIDDPALLARSIALPREADVVAAVSPPLVEQLAAHGVDALLIPNGVDVDHFAAAVSAGPAPDVVALPGVGAPGTPGRRVAGFVGHLGDRMDLSLVAAVADRGITVLLAGPRQRTAAAGALEALLERPNVHWIGARPYAELPSILAAADVWLLPYGDSEFNRASFPLKLLEYLAAGRRVVATDLPAVRWLETDLVDVASAPAAFADAVAAALASPLSAEESTRRIEFASHHSWASRIGLLASRIALRDPISATKETVR